MSISSLNSLTSAYQGYANSAQNKTSTSSDSPDTSTLEGFISQQTMTATNTTTGAAENQTMQSMPLAVAWAPQMFSQGDQNNDDSLSPDEFQAQLARVGVSADAAKQLFQTFDTSKDGQVSLSEFVTGVSNSIASGSHVFNDLMDSYTRDSNGNLNKAAMDNFLSTGLDAANTFWKNLPPR